MKSAAVPNRIPPPRKRGGKTISAAQGSTAARVARARPRAPSTADRLPGDTDITEQLSQRVDEANKRKVFRQDAEKRKTTPRNKRTHAVQNGNVHDSNDSARQLDARDSIERDSERPVAWTRPSSNDAPPPRSGMRQRWIRYKTGNQEDTDNLDKALDQGWRPVKRSRRSQVHELTADSGGKFGQYIVKRGRILMEVPVQTVTERNRFYRDKQKRMNQGIDEDLFQLDNRYMPMQRPERHSRVSTKARRGRLEVPGDEAEA